MRAFFAVALVTGLLALVAWLMSAASGAVRLDPERRFGWQGRAVVGALVGLGMAGLSAAYAGWPDTAAAGAAMAGAVTAGWYAGRFGPERR